MLSRILNISDQLPPAEARVANWLLEHARRPGRLRLADVARGAGVSEPTVVRFCRRAGASGFSDLKLQLARDVATRPEHLHAEVTDLDPADVVADKVLGASIRALERVRQSVDAEALSGAAVAINGARRILFMGFGASAAVALDAHNKFFRLGLPCAAYCDAPSVRQAAAVSDSDSVLVAISKAGESTALVDALVSGRRRRATTIAVTAPASSLARLADHLLLVDVDEDTTLYTPMSSRIAQLAVLDALQLVTAIRGGETALANLEASKQALARTADRD